MGKIEIDDITEKTVENNLYTSGQPDVDLLIRTSGQIRTKWIFFCLGRQYMQNLFY